MDELNEGEEREHGDDEGGGGLPQELQFREQRRARIRVACAQLETEKGEKLESQHQKSFADPEANMMKMGDGALGYCYNAQAATSEDGIIVATGLSAAANDVTELMPMIEAVEANTGECPGVALADHGYLSEATLAELDRRGQRCLVAVGRERKKGTHWPRGEFTQRMHRVLRFGWAQSLYAHRKTQAERPFAEIKQRLRFQRFMLRGQEKARGEWDLVCAALNLQTLWRRAPA
jgi:hypothetical protein